MCIVCILYEKGKLTKQEADRALTEIITESSDNKELIHAQEAVERIMKEII